MNTSLLESVWEAPDRRPQLDVRGWETLLGEARQARMLARLAVHHADRGWVPSVPDGPRRHLEGALRLADRQKHEVRWEVDCISRALGPVDFPVVLLKGAAYLMSELPCARGRLFADIDVMVPIEHIQTAENAFFAGGWISGERDGYNQRYYRKWMHEIPPLHHVLRNTTIDLHHTITPPTSRFHVDGAKLLAHIEPIKGHAGFFVLAPTDIVLHSAVHLFQEGEFAHGLRDLLDLHDLLLHFGARSGFWCELLDRADELGLAVPLFHALFHIRRLTGSAAPADLIERVGRMGPNSVSRVLMAWMLGLALKPKHPSCDTRWTGLARWLLYVRSHALRMPVYLLVPHLVRKAWMRRFPGRDA